MPEHYCEMLVDEYTGVLPVGYVDSSEKLHRVIKFRPEGMLGSDEYKLSDPKVKENGTKALTALFSNGIIQSIGDITKITPDLARNLTNADRDYILFMNRQITFGDQLVYKSTCSSNACKNVNEVTVFLEQAIEVVYLPDNVTRDSNGFATDNMDLPLGILDPKTGQRHKHVVFRYPTGSDSEALEPIAKVNLALANSNLMHRIILSIGDLTAPNIGVYDKMSSKDRQAFIDYLYDNSPGPNFVVNVTCPVCGNSYESVIPISALLSDSR